MNKLSQIMSSKLDGNETNAKTEISVYESTGFLTPGVVQSTLIEMNQKTQLNLPDAMVEIKKYLEKQK